ncbi:MAG TPA: metallophosphoesterase family protein [Streptosporangiaceae bacterium]
MARVQDEPDPPTDAPAAAADGPPAALAVLAGSSPPGGPAILDGDDAGLSRRQVLAGASGAGLLAAGSRPLPAAPRPPAPQRRPAPAGRSDGTPEQIHLTWGRDPATSVSVSWAALDPAVRPRVLLSGPSGSRAASAVRRTYTDGLSGEVVYTYHAQLTGLLPDAVYSYAVTSDNDSAAVPFSATFRTAPRGRAPFRFTSFSDLATPNPKWALSYGQAACAVAAVESFQPLFHLLNGNLCYAGLSPASQPDVWRDFGANCQSSAAYRAWMPCPGNHEIEFGNGPQGLASYLTRYTLPDNGVPGFRGRWYSFRVGSVLFVSLDASDVVLQDAGPLVPGPEPLVPAAGAGTAPIPAGTSFYVRGYSQGAQSTWLERTLAAARGDTSIDWIIVQLHQDAMSSSSAGHGSDLGIRQAWLPLFDQYQVDLVLSGHDRDYERSFPVRGFDAEAGRDAVTGAPVPNKRPRAVTADPDATVFDTSHGTVHLVLGGGGTSAPLDEYGINPASGRRQAKVFTRPNRPGPAAEPGTFSRGGADALEDAAWSAMRDTATGYGLAVFDVHPGEVRGGMTSIMMRYFHAVGADPVHPDSGRAGAPNPKYTEFETITLVRRRSDGLAD